MDRWAELRTALHVANLGTVSAAAQALNIHRATVNRHIDLLEDAIGGRIFIRHARGYTLTELGEDVLRVAQKTDELIDDLAGRVRSGRSAIEGEIRLTILAPFASLVMQPVANFQSKNPHCQVKVDVSEDLAKLEYGEAHIAVRAGPKPDHPDYVVQPLGRVRFGLYANRIYLDGGRRHLDKSDLSNHRFVVPPVPAARVPFAAWIAENVTPEQIAFESMSAMVNAEAIDQGIGLGFLPEHIAADNEEYQAVIPPQKDWSVGLWVVTHTDLHRTEKVLSMLGFLKAEITTRLTH